MVLFKLCMARQRGECPVDIATTRSPTHSFFAAPAPASTPSSVMSPGISLGPALLQRRKQGGAAWAHAGRLLLFMVVAALALLATTVDAAKTVRHFSIKDEARMRTRQNTQYFRSNSVRTLAFIVNRLPFIGHTVSQQHPPSTVHPSAPWSRCHFLCPSRLSSRRRAVPFFVHCACVNS